MVMFCRRNMGVIMRVCRRREYGSYYEGVS